MSVSEDLCSIPYTEGGHDCFNMIRRYLWMRFEVWLPNFARPKDHLGYEPLNRFHHFEDYGFRPVMDEPFQEGDILLVCIRSSLINHCAVVVENNQILHHVEGTLSRLDPLYPKWAHRAIATARHPSVTEALAAEKKKSHLHEVVDADVFRDPDMQDILQRAMGS